MNPTLWINNTNLIQNFKTIKEKTKSSFICPMVKANAYGVGDTLVVGSLLEVGAKHFGVARDFEAEKLRRFFPNKDFEILVFNSLSAGNIKAYIESRLTPVLSSAGDLKILDGLSLVDRLKIKKLHLKFDLGMSRFGFALEDSRQIFEKIKGMGLSVEGVCGHFSTSEDFVEDKSLSQQKLVELITCAQEFGVSEERVHAPNTAAIERGNFQVGLRPGIGLYGVSQSTGTPLKGVLRLTAPLVSLNWASKGQRVSYGGTWEALKSSQIGVLPIGYADGLRRGLSNRIRFVLNGKAYPQVGVICMDYCMVDLGSTEKFQIGDNVCLFDESYSDLFEWAELLGTIPYELITGLGERIERRTF